MKNTAGLSWTCGKHTVLGMVAACLFLCAACSTPSPSELEQAAGESSSQTEADPKILALKSSLMDQPVSGFVVVSGGVSKYPTLEAALEVTDGPRTVGPYYVHHVVRDHGAVVEVRPISRRAMHCTSSHYDTTDRFEITGFVRKADLIPVVVGEVEVEFDDASTAVVRSGMPIVSADPYRIRMGGLFVDLPDHIDVSLSYEEPGPVFPWSQQPAEAVVFEETKVHVTGSVLEAGQIYLTAPSSFGRSGRRLSVMESEPVEEGRQNVTLHSNCVKLRFVVDEAAFGPARARGRLGGLGRATDGASEDAASAPEGAAESVFPAETPLHWEGTEVQAGRTVGQHGAEDFLSDGDCFTTNQGFGQATVCISTSSVAQSCDKTACELEGRCTAVDGICAAASDEDCAQSRLCTSRGMCRAQDGECVGEWDDECREQPACASTGACGRVERRGMVRCLPTSAEMCQASRACARAGACGLEGGECRATTEEMCQASEECKSDAKCSLRRGQCVAASEEDCAQSALCTEEGRCGMVIEEVELSDAMQDTAASMAVSMGQTTRELRRCMPTETAHCEQSSRCKEHGYCQRVKQASPPPPPGQRRDTQSIGGMSHPFGGGMRNLSDEPEAWWCVPRH